jgi:hypothetical protein
VLKLLPKSATELKNTTHLTESYMDRIRKQVYDLTAADLEAYPMWEFAGDEECEEGQDEATVRPWLGESYDPADIYGVVRTKFRLADGSIMIGFITPPLPSDIEKLVMPEIITPQGQVGLWFAPRLTSEQLAHQYELLQRTADEVFPIQYETDFPIIGGPITGRIDGFQGFAASGTREILTIK